MRTGRVSRRLAASPATPVRSAEIVETAARHRRPTAGDHHHDPRVRSGTQSRPVEAEETARRIGDRRSEGQQRTGTPRRRQHHHREPVAGETARVDVVRPMRAPALRTSTHRSKTGDVVAAAAARGRRVDPCDGSGSVNASLDRSRLDPGARVPAAPASRPPAHAPWVHRIRDREHHAEDRAGL